LFFLLNFPNKTTEGEWPTSGDKVTVVTTQ